mgnify:CR=1 FL=1
MEKTIFEELGGKYERQGDYLIPCLTVPVEEEQPIGTRGQRHLRLHQSHTTVENITRYNSAVLGIQNYYRIATNVYNNLDRINYSLIRTHYNRLRIIAKRVRFRDTPLDFQKKTKGLSALLYRVMFSTVVCD